MENNNLQQEEILNKINNNLETINQNNNLEILININNNLETIKKSILHMKEIETWLNNRANRINDCCIAYLMILFLLF